MYTDLSLGTLHCFQMKELTKTSIMISNCKTVSALSVNIIQTYMLQKSTTKLHHLIFIISNFTSQRNVIICLNIPLFYFCIRHCCRNITLCTCHDVWAIRYSLLLLFFFQLAMTYETFGTTYFFCFLLFQLAITCEPFGISYCSSFCCFSSPLQTNHSVPLTSLF